MYSQFSEGMKKRTSVLNTVVTTMSSVWLAATQIRIVYSNVIQRLHLVYTIARVLKVVQLVVICARAHFVGVMIRNRTQTT